MLGHPLLDDYLEFVAARARPNTLLAAAYDLKVFFTEVVKQPAEVTTADVFAFLKAQRAPRRGRRVVRLEDGEAGLAARTIARRLVERVAACSPISRPGVTPGWHATRCRRGLAARRPRRSARGAGVPLIRSPADAAAGAVAGRGRRAAGGAAHAPGPGDGRGDAAGRAATLRGARAAAARRQRRASGGCSSPRARAAGSGSCRSRPGSSPPWADYLDTSGQRTCGTERVFVVLKGPRRGAAAVGGGAGRDPRRCPGAGPGWSRRRATSCGTPVSPGCGRRGWRWRPSRPRPGTPRSSRPASTCTWPTTGWPRSTCGRRRRSKRRRLRP